MGGGGNFQGRKLTPENACQEICPPSPKEKKRKKKKTGDHTVGRRELAGLS